MTSSRNGHDPDPSGVCVPIADGQLVANGSYLRDVTGNRRHWPVPVGRVDLEGLRLIRDQLWAEAVALVEAGERYWPHESEDDLFAEEQSQRQERDPWHDEIEKALTEYNETTTTWILSTVLALDIQRQDQKAKNRVARVLSTLGWKARDSKDAHRHTMRVYRRTRDLVTNPKPFEPSAPVVDPYVNGASRLDSDDFSIDDV